MKRAVRIAVFVLCVVFSVAAVVNVFADNTEVEAMAGRIACEGATVKPLPPSAPPGSKPSETCAMTMTKLSRTPFAQSFEFSSRAGTRRVRCSRSLILVGDYACAAE